MVRITALMDNEPSEHQSLIHEHGLSYLIEREDCRILFDCGASISPWQNARRLGRSVHRLDAVVLSHSHYDHAAGFRDLIELGNGSQLLYTGPGFFTPKFSFDGLLYTDISAGFTADFLVAHDIRHKEVQGLAEIFPGIYLISGFPRTHDFETIPKRFVRQTQAGFVPDDFSDEICMALELEGKLVVLVGCSHPGILNMMQHVRQVLGRPIYAVFGGTHLKEANDERIALTIAQLQEMGLELLGLSHCSGSAAECVAQQTPAVKSCHMSVGKCVFLA